LARQEAETTLKLLRWTGRRALPPAGSLSPPAFLSCDCEILPPTGLDERNAKVTEGKGKKGFLQLQSHVHTSVALPGEAGGKVLAFFVFSVILSIITWHDGQS
jgi:hypothetical protein